ncbi:hypothetical protein FDECE_4046 [Fusarium decemcellulare]|nr:hypothetical protein FDECE_4046 [Fusarium decemcellulare]
MSYQTNPRRPKRPPKVRQACDACHLRKTRCDGCKPCSNCLNSTANCTYLAVHKKTGPKRGTRHGQRPLQRQQVPSTWQRPYYSYTSPSDGGSSNIAITPQGEIAPEGPAAEELGDGFQPSPQVTVEVVRWCLDAYFKHKYPLTPILNRQQMGQSLQNLPDSPEQYGLITALCAVISLSPEIFSTPSSPPEIAIPPADFLISETIHSRQHYNLVENQSLTHVQTSFFLYAAFFCMDKDNAAWYYLRESITILQSLRLHEEATYADISDQSFAKYARRMFWVLFITERGYALQRNRPITLQNTLNLPVVDPSSADAEILLGFLDLISLFRHFDADFIGTWNSATLSTATDPEHLSKLQGLLKHTLPSISSHTLVQQADLLVSRQWLKVIVWKLCVSKTLLSIADSEDSMSLLYPAAVARDVVSELQLVPTQAFEANGIGILEKVFDVACSLADLLSLVPVDRRQSAMNVGPVDTLMEMVRIVGSTFGGSFRYLDMLADKANRCLLMNVDRSLPPPVEEYFDEEP